MAKTIKELIVGLGVRADDKQARQFDKTMQSVKRTAMATAAAVGAIGGVLAKFAKDTADSALQSERLSQSLGVTAQEAQELEFAFQKFGADSGDVSDAINTITDRAEDAKGGMQSFIDDFGLLGIEVDDLRGKQPTELFRLFADRMSETEDVNKRVAAAVRIFGDDVGRKLLPMLSEGADGLDQMASEAERLGFIMSEEDIEQSAAFSRSLDNLKLALTGVRNTIGNAVIPIMQRGAEIVTQWTADLNVFIQDVGGVDRVLQVLTATVTTLVGYMAGQTVLAAIKNFQVIMQMLSTGLSRLPMIAAFVVLVLVVEDLIAMFRGGDSVIGDFIENLQSGEGTLGKIGDVIGDIVDWFKDLGETIGNEVSPLIDEAKNTVNELLGSFMAMWAEIQPILKLLGNVLIDVFSVYWKYYAKPVFTMLWNIVKTVARAIIEQFRNVFELVGDYLGWLKKLWSGEFDSIGEAVKAFVDIFVDYFADGIANAGELLSGLLQSVLSTLGRVGEAIAGVLNKIPGINIDMSATTSGAASEAATGARSSAQSGMIASTGDTTITVNAETNADPDEIAEQVGQKQREERDRELRQLQNEFAGGEA